MLFRYQDRLKITHQQAIETPWVEIERAFYIWSLDDERVKLESEKHKH